MKTLELNQMEKLVAGDAQCMMGMGVNAMLGGMIGGPVGYFIGMGIGYYMNC
jgi:hypothetical protein|tara:strand:+ start:729 stop:884 length:156 start_codon:yes stop_codon:yes gene_type:complete